MRIVRELTTHRQQVSQLPRLPLRPRIHEPLARLELWSHLRAHLLRARPHRDVATGRYLAGRASSFRASIRRGWVHNSARLVWRQWSIHKSTFSLTIDVPAGTSGVVKLPVSGKVSVNGQARRVEKGEGVQLAGGKHAIAVLA